MSANPDFVALDELAQTSDAQFYWHPLRQVALLTKENRRVQVSMRNAQITLGDHFIEAVVRFEQGQPLVQAAQAQMISLYLTGQPFTLTKNETGHKVAIILIDAGHGGRDAGATRKHGTLEVKEKVITLALALELEARLKKLYPDKQILMTRRDDSFPTLEERVAMANALSVGEREAILYLSIHVNSALTAQASGFEVWHLPSGFEREVFRSDEHSSAAQKVINDLMNIEYHSSSRRWAQLTLDAFERHIGAVSPNRGIKERNWFVVRNARMAAILVEVGFLSHPAEAKRLTQRDHQMRIVQALSEGVNAYVQFFEGRP